MIRSRAAASLRRENGAGLWSRTLRLTKDRSYASVTTSTPAASTTATQRWSLSRSNGSAAAAAASAREMHCHDSRGTSSGYRRSSGQRWCASSSPGTPNSAYICLPLRRCFAFSSAGSGSSALGMIASGNVHCGGGGGGIPARLVGHVMHMTTSAVPGKKKRKKPSAESGETANGITFETGKVMSHERYLLCCVCSILSTLQPTRYEYIHTWS